MSIKRVRVVAALIADPQDPSRYLVQQRLPGKSRPLLWEFPGGKVEQGETDEQALAREGQEELAVELAIGRKRWESAHAYPDLEVTLALYDATIVSGVPQPLSCHALRFATPSQMNELPFCEADIPLLRELAAGTL